MATTWRGRAGPEAMTMKSAKEGIYFSRSIDDDILRLVVLERIGAPGASWAGWVDGSRWRMGAVAGGEAGCEVL